MVQFFTRFIHSRQINAASTDSDCHWIPGICGINERECATVCPRSMGNEKGQDHAP